MILNELFQPAQAMPWVSHGGLRWLGQFEVEDVPFQLIIDNEGDPDEEGFRSNVWEVLFKIPDRYARDNGLSVCGNSGLSRTASVRVLAMVVGGIEQFLRERKPDVLSFTGSTKLGKDSLYAAMARTLAKRTQALGYHVTHEAAEGETVFQIKPLPSAS